MSREKTRKAFLREELIIIKELHFHLQSSSLYLWNKITLSHYIHDELVDGLENHALVQANLLSELSLFGRKHVQRKLLLKIFLLVSFSNHQSFHLSEVITSFK